MAGDPAVGCQMVSEKFGLTICIHYDSLNSALSTRLADPLAHLPRSGPLFPGVAPRAQLGMAISADAGLLWSIRSAESSEFGARFAITALTWVTSALAKSAPGVGSIHKHTI